MSYTSNFLSELEKLNKKKKEKESLFSVSYNQESPVQNLIQRVTQPKYTGGDDFTQSFLDELYRLEEEEKTERRSSIKTAFSNGWNNFKETAKENRQRDLEEYQSLLKNKGSALEEYGGYIAKYKSLAENETLLSRIESDTGVTRSEYNRYLELKDKFDGTNGVEHSQSMQLFQAPKVWEGTFDKFDDGYDFGDITKTILKIGGNTAATVGATAADLGVGAVKGVLKTGENIADFIDFRIADVAEHFGNKEYAENLREMTNWNVVDNTFEGVDTFLDKGSVLGRTADSVAEGIGQAGAMLALGSLGGSALSATAITTGTGFISGAGAGETEALQSGATTEEARKYGLISGAADAATELLFGGLGKGSNALGFGKGLSSADDMLAKGVSEKIANTILKNATDSTKTVGKNLIQFGIKSGAEGFEEVLAGFVQAVGKKTTYMSDKEFKDILEDENLLEQFVVAALTSGIMQTGDLVRSNKTGRDFVSGLSKNEQSVIDKEFENRVNAEEQDGKKLSAREKNKLYEAVLKDMEKGYISTDTIEEVLGGDTYKSYKDTIDSEDAQQSKYDSLQSEFDTLYKTKQGDMTGEQIDRLAELKNKLPELKKQLQEMQKNSQRNQLKTKLSEEVSALVAKDRLSNSYYEKSMRQHAFKADLSKYDEKQRVIVKAAIDSGVLNNTRRTHELVDMVAKLSADKGVLFDFTNNAKLKESGFAIDGKTINGFVKDGKITINTQSAKYINSVVGHEITHILEGTELYTELQNTLFEYAKSKGDYQGRIDMLTEMYKGVAGADVNAELTADLVGDYLFTDADFINNLSTNNRNLFQKIYDEIKYLYKVATAGSKEARELEKVKKAFDKAYKNSKTADNGTKYSLSETTDGQFVAVVDNDILSNIDSSSWDNTKKAEAKKAAADALKKFSDGIVVDGITRKVNRVSRREYTRSNYTESLYNTAPDVFADKMRAADVADDIVVAATNWMRDGGLNHPRNDNFVDFDHGKTLILSGNSKYIAEVVVGITDTGEAVLYDVVDMTPTTFDIKKDESPTTATTQNAIGDIQGDSSAENVAQETPVVKGQFSISDSNGRQLSNEQAEYFKDSKVRDENGNLMVLYHGTQNDFTVFDVSRSGENYEGGWSEYGEGIYMTPDKKTAEYYGDNAGWGREVKLMEVYADIKNLFNVNEPVEFDISDLTKKYELTEFDERHIKQYGNRLVEFLQHHKESVRDYLTSKGYDGVWEKGLKGDVYQVVAYTENQVKNTDNTKPTADPDIRFSLSDDNWSQISEMQQEINRLNESIREFEASDDFKAQMKKISKAVDAGNVDAGVKEYQRWLKESGYEELTNKRNALRDELQNLRKKTEELRASKALEEERTAIEKSGLSEADYFRKQAVKEFGYTPYFYDAGYITTNGKMLNFSGEKGQHFGSRGQDHRAIGSIYAETDGTDALNRFVNEGNIRISPESPGIDVSATTEPTTEQYATIKRFAYAYANKEYFSVDISDKDGRVVGSLQYENRINPLRIISDLKHYYATGEIRQPSTLEGFRWSLSEDSQGRELSPAVKNRFANSKVVDENGNLKAVYHGTASGEFSIFDKQKGNVEGDFGSGFYFTDNEADVSEHYEGGGPDFERKVELLAERIEQDEDIDYDEAEIKAREQLYKGSHKFEVYLNIENPAVVGKTYLLTQDEALDRYNEEDFDDYDDYIAEVEQAVADDIENIVWEVEKNVDVYSTDGLSDILFEAYYEGGIGIEELKSRINELYLEDNNGNYVGNEVTRQIIESLGYDGIIDPTVSTKWNMDMEAGTTHYIVFKPNQIKSVTNENPTDNPDIHKSLSNIGDTPKRYGNLTISGKDVALETAQEDIAPVQEVVEQPVQEEVTPVDKLFPDDLAPMAEDEDDFQDRLASIDDADAPPEIVPNYDEMADVTPLTQKIVKDIAKELRNKLAISNKQMAEVHNLIREYGASEFPSREQLYQDVKSRFGKYTEKYQDEQVTDAKKLLRSYRINVSDFIKSEIADYGNLMRSNFGKVRFSKEGVPVDVAYMELSEQFPNLFPKDIYVPTDQLLKIIDVANTDATEEYSIALDDEVIREATDVIANGIMEYQQQQKEKSANRFTRDSFNSLMQNADEYAPPVEEDIAPVAKSNTDPNRVVTNNAENIKIFDAKDPNVPEGQQALWEEPVATNIPKARKMLHQSIIDNAKKVFSVRGFDLDSVLKKAKDLSTFATVDNTPQRVMEKALGYKEGGILADLTVNKVAQNETEGIKWLNSFTDRKNGLLAQISRQYNIKPGSKESAAAQMYAEGFYVDANNNIIKYGDTELAIDFPNATVQKNIKGLARDQRIRQIYDETLAAINASRERNAYPEIPRLDNYFLHFRAMDDTFSRLGLPFNPNDIRAKDLPTDLNGVTADLKPGQPYFASAMHRKGKRTSFDLLGGLERYLTSAKNQIYHIDDIQTLRALRNYVADTYGQANGLEGLDALSEEEAQERIEKVYNSHLSTFAKFLNEEANVLAGKTALIDRGLEGIFGRRGITFLDTVNKQVGSNMVGLNISSSLTNFLPVAQTFAKTNKADFVKAFGQTVANKVGSIFGRTDSFTENSPVVIRRKGAERFYRTPYQKIGDTGYVFMSVVDDISTELIARTKYNELTRKGMDSQQAHYETDKWVSRLMGDRSLGQQPHLYNSKMLGLFTKFQLEVRNQLDSQFYDTIKEATVSNEHIQNGLERNAKTAAKVTSTFAQLAIAQHLFGKAFESVAGYNPAFDIISALVKLFGFDDEEESEDTMLDNVEQAFFELMGDMPYVSTLTGGRIPIASALPIEELYKGEDQYGNEKSRWETLSEAVPYYLLPGGYGQVKKTYQGLSMFDEDHPIAGSYTDSGNLRFPVEDTLGNRVQAGIFGQWSSENARDYFDNERKPLKENQIQEFIDIDIPIRDYWEYREGLSGLKTTEEKADYIDSLDLPIDKKNILINNILDRKDSIDLEEYKKYSSFEEFDFAEKNPEKYAFFKDNGISYSNYASADEDLKRTYTWAYNNPEKYDFLKDNGVSLEDYSGFDDETKDAYSWAYNNPEKHTVSKAVSNDFMTYWQYRSDMSELDAKDENGETVSGLKKERVIDYINNLDIDYGQKIILFRSMYDSKADRAAYNQDIVDYLNSRDDISYSEMVTILKELDFTVTADGTVYWD